MSKKPHTHSFAKRLTRWLMLSLLLTLGTIAFMTFWVAMSAITALESTRNLNVLDTTNERITNVLSSTENAANNHQRAIEQNINNEKGLEQTLRTLLEMNPNITGAAVAFVDHYFPKKGKWYELYARRNGNQIEVEQIGSEQHDYLSANWFLKCIEEKKPYWSNAYLDDTGARDMLTTYAIPIHNAQGKVVAVMGSDVSLGWLQGELKRMDEENNSNSWLFTGREKDTSDKVKDRFYSYSFIIEKGGTYLVHPDEKRIMHENFFQHCKATDDMKDDKIAQVIQHGYRGLVTDDDDMEATFMIDGKECYIFYGTIEHTGWTTIIAVPAYAVNILGYVVGGIITLVVAMGIIISLVICYLIVRHNTKPLKKLTKVIKEVGQGHFDVALPVVKKNDEIKLLRDSFEKMQSSLAKYMDELQETTAKKASIESELHIAHDIQMAMLPKKFPPYPERKDIDIYGELTPAKAVGGDLFDFFLSEDQLFFCVGDVSGKGVPASLVMAVTRSLFRSISAHASSPDKIVHGINEAICEGNESCMFVTLFVGVLELKSGLMHYCNAGHNAPLLIGQSVGLLPCDSNLPAGIMTDWDFTLQETRIERQSTIFLYTDGLNEAEDSQHNQLGDERVVKVAESLLANNNHQPESLITAMTGAVHEFVGNAEQSDDLTMLAIQLK